MNKQYWRFAINNESEFNKMLSNQGLSPQTGGCSPSAYILEKCIIKHFKTIKPTSIDRELLRYIDIDWLERKLNKVSDCEELESLHQLLLSDVNEFIRKLKHKSK
jgi:hypothetical protein